MPGVSDEENKRYIREIQEFLRAIAYYDERIPLVAVDGIFDDKTAAAVGAFQAAVGLPVTEEVDKATFDRLYRDYLAAVARSAQAERIIGFPDKTAVLKPGDTGFEVLLLQIMLKALAERFDNIADVTLSGRYDYDTNNAVEQVKKASDITTPGVDKNTWNAVTRLYNQHLH